MASHGVPCWELASFRNLQPRAGDGVSKVFAVGGWKGAAELRVSKLCKQERRNTRSHLCISQVSVWRGVE